MDRQTFHPRVERSRHIHCPAYQPSGLVGSDGVDIESICVKVPEHRKILRAALASPLVPFSSISDSIAIFSIARTAAESLIHCHAQGDFEPMKKCDTHREEHAAGSRKIGHERACLSLLVAVLLRRLSECATEYTESIFKKASPLAKE